MQHAAPLAQDSSMRCARCRASVPRPRSAWRSTCCRRGRGGARTLAEALTEGLASIQPLRRCRMLTDAELCSICAATVARCLVAVRGGITRGRGRGGAVGQLSRPLLRAARASVAARWHRARADRCARIRGAARFGRGPRSDPRDQSDGRRRGDRAFPRRTRGRRARSRRAASRTACRSAASSSTWTAARSPTRSRDGQSPGLIARARRKYGQR